MGIWWLICHCRRILFPYKINDEIKDLTLRFSSFLRNCWLGFHKTIRSMHRCPPQLERPLLNPCRPQTSIPDPRVFFYFLSSVVPCPRAIFSHRNRDILSRIARVSCDPFFSLPLMRSLRSSVMHDGVAIGARKTRKSLVFFPQWR